MIKQLLDEVEQYFEICQWQADQLFAEAFWYVDWKNSAFILSFSWSMSDLCSRDTSVHASVVDKFKSSQVTASSYNGERFQNMNFLT